MLMLDFNRDTVFHRATHEAWFILGHRLSQAQRDIVCVCVLMLVLEQKPEPAVRKAVLRLQDFSFLSIKLETV